MLAVTTLLAACGAGTVNSPLQSSAQTTTTTDAKDVPSSATPQVTMAQAKTKIAETSARRVRQQKGVKVAILLPLSARGGAAKIARALKQAGELAMFDFNNPDIILTAKDTKGTPAGAKAAAVKAVESGAELIIGPLFSRNVRAAAPIAKKAGVPMVALSTDRKVAGDGVYLLSFLAGQDVDRIVSFAISRGKRRFAALIPSTAYGNIVADAFNKAISRYGAELVMMQRYPVDPNGMLKPVEKIAALARTKDPETDEPLEPQIDALFMPSNEKIIPILSPILPYYAVDTKAVKLIGAGGWDYRGIGREKPLFAGWYPGPDPKGWRSFTQRYAATYGKAPPRIASLAYDAVSLAVSLARLPHGQRYTSAQLTRKSGFAGVDGLFRLKKNGISERGLAILEVQKFGPRVIDRAPSVFTTRTTTTTASTWGGLQPRF